MREASLSRVRLRTPTTHPSMQHAVVRGRFAYVQLQQTLRHVRAYTGSHMYPPDPVSNPAQPTVPVEKLAYREVMPAGANDAGTFKAAYSMQELIEKEKQKSLRGAPICKCKH